MWLPSIATVHLKPQLSSPPIPSSHVAKTLLRLLSQFRSLTTVIQSTHSNEFHSVHSFLSKCLKISAKMGFIRQGKQVHAHAVKVGLCGSLSLGNKILNVYVKCDEFNDAHKLFDEIRVRNLVTWNTMICGIVDYGSNYKSCIYTGFSYFRRMLLDKAVLDHITLNGLLRAGLEVKDVEIGRQLHSFVVKLGFELSCFVNSALIDFYGKCGLVKEARCVFDKALCRDMVLWNVMVSCYALNCLGKEAFGVFNLMRQENLAGDGFTYSSILNSCGTLVSCELGRQIHGIIIKLSFDLDVLVASGLVDMYAKSENIDDARKAFEGMAAKNVVSWNTMVVGYGQHGDRREAMKLFHEMFRADFDPDELTLASILSSCGSTSASCEIMQVHAYVVKNGLHAFTSIANALINAYSKCGRIDRALQCFKAVREPDLVTWTSLIGAYAFHSRPQGSIEIFEKMLFNGVRPDRIAFLGVLSACSHAGLVTQGLHYFGLMIKEYEIVPDFEHYTCLIDLLGRAGCLDEAFNVLTSIPFECGSDPLEAFIGACQIHGNIKLAKWAAKKLLALEPNKPANYTLMSKIYASEGHWHDVARMHKLMEDRCAHRFPGCSWMELGVC